MQWLASEKLICYQAESVHFSALARGQLVGLIDISPTHHDIILRLNSSVPGSGVSTYSTSIFLDHRECLHARPQVVQKPL